MLAFMHLCGHYLPARASTHQPPQPFAFSLPSRLLAHAGSMWALLDAAYAFAHPGAPTLPDHPADIVTPR